MIIGITGTLGAGKGTIVDYLVNNHLFKHYSVRGFLLEELDSRGMERNRDNMRDVANELRAKFGPSYIVEQLYIKAHSDGGNSVIESIRAVGEVKKLQEHDDFYLWSVDADSKIRYDRILKRKSSTDLIDYETFIKQEQAEMNNKEEHMQNIAKCMELADKHFSNNNSFDDLYLQIEQTLEGLL